MIRRSHAMQGHIRSHAGMMLWLTHLVGEFTDARAQDGVHLHVGHILGVLSHNIA